jgi:alcohol dehydrogenase
MSFEFHARTRVVFGPGSCARIGELAGELGFKRTLLVSDSGLQNYAAIVESALLQAGVHVARFEGFAPNPDTAMVELGRIAAAAFQCDSIIGLGGGSSLDCAKAINFVHSCGGSMRDYWGHGKATRPLLPMIGIPTTAGTGSEAQSYCIISDAETHVKMACGDEKAAFRIAILDPDLTQSAPRLVTATAGYDALSHAVEAYVTTKGNPLSRGFARQAFEWLEPNLERVLAGDAEARSAMLLGANLAGLAIEHSMLGAAHACANPLTAQFGITHGIAVSLMLPHVVRWNQAAGVDYSALSHRLADRLIELAAVCEFPLTLPAAGVPPDKIPTLAEDAAKQWTGRFNPRPFDAHAASALYRAAFVE